MLTRRSSRQSVVTGQEPNSRESRNRFGVLAVAFLGCVFTVGLPVRAVQVGPDDMRISHMGPDGNTTFGGVNPAVAYNSRNNEFFVVWSGDDNNGALVDEEYEIWGQRIDAATGASIGGRIRISDMGPAGDVRFRATECDVVYNSTNNEYLVVWRGEDDVGVLVDDEFEIFGQRIDAATGAEVGPNDFRISDMNGLGNTGGNAQRPAVAYNSANNEYLVVWQGHEANPPLALGEWEIFGQRLAADGAEVGFNDFRISDAGPDGNTSYEAMHPDVAYNSINNEYLVVWKADDGVDNEYEIHGQRIDGRTGAELGANDFRISDMGPDGNTGFKAEYPSVAHAAAGNVYLVVWNGDDDTASSPDENEVFGQLLDGAAGTEVGVNDFRISHIGPDGERFRGAFYPSVACNADAGEFLVAYQGNDSGFSEYEVFVQRISSTTRAVLGADDARISIFGPEGDMEYDAFEPRLAYSSGSRRYMVVWYGDDDTAPLVNDEFEVFGQLFSTATSVAITSIWPAAPRAGENVVVSYSVTSEAGAPTGSVTIGDGTSGSFGTVAGGNCTLVFHSPGVRSLTAAYSGDSDFSPSTSAAVSLTVGPPLATVVISGTAPNPSVVGQPVTVRFRVESAAGTPTGSVTVSDGTQTCVGNVAEGGCTLTFTTAGSKSLTATYGGDATFAPAVSLVYVHTVQEAGSATTLPSDAPDAVPAEQTETPAQSPQCGACGTGSATLLPLAGLCLAVFRKCVRRPARPGHSAEGGGGTGQQGEKQLNLHGVQHVSSSGIASRMISNMTVTSPKAIAAPPTMQTAMLASKIQ